MNGRYCVLIPALNAAQTIASLVERVKNQGLTVIVIDDGSTDETALIAAKLGATVISHLHNRGKGTALRTGFQYALRMAYDGVITMDGDGQHDPMDIPRVIRSGEREHAGIVLGNRMGDAQAMPRLRRWTNQVMSRVISRLVHQPIPDSQCGFRLIRKEVLQSVSLRATRFEIETELLLFASTHRWKIVSVPVQTIYQNSASRIQVLPDLIRVLQVIARHLTIGWLRRLRASWYANRR